MTNQNSNNDWGQPTGWGEEVSPPENLVSRKAENLTNNSVEPNSVEQSKALSGVLSSADRKLLNALSLRQLDYGQTNEAIALLILCRQSAHDDLQTLRLLIRAYIDMEWWDKADEMGKELTHYSKNDNHLIYLFSALTLLGRSKIQQAQEQFKIFCKSKQKVAN